VIRPGLVSITFRHLAAPAIVDLAVRAGLVGIEWGGDVHVPAGDRVTARRIAQLTADAGLTVAAYGSYYRVGCEAAGPFERVLDTAIALGAGIIRVWAGKVGSRQADAQMRARVAEDARRIAGLAAVSGRRIACEWHGGTLTDSAESARALFAAVDHPAFATYWQPHQRMSAADCLDDLAAALPRLVGLHVFHWDEADVSRLPLAAGATRWRAFLAAAAGRFDGYALLEFVRGDDPAALLEDALTLRGLLGELAEGGGRERRE